MPVRIDKRDDNLTVALEGEITIRDVQGISAELGEAMHGVVSVTIVAVRVADIDTSILQLLCSLRKTAPVLSFEDPSKEFVAAVDRCGLRRELLGGLREGA